MARRQTATELLLVVSAHGAAPRSHVFPDLPTLQKFQIALDASLINAGWTFLEFSPDNRDRRGLRVADDERRRWWTDGLPGAKSVLGE